MCKNMVYWEETNSFIKNLKHCKFFKYKLGVLKHNIGLQFT